MAMDLNPVMIVLLIKFLLIFVLSNFRLNESSPLCYRPKKKRYNPKYFIVEKKCQSHKNERLGHKNA